VTDDAVRALRAWVLHPDLRSDKGRKAAGPALDEALALARALPELDVAGGEIIRLDKPKPGLLFGKGKVDELRARLQADDIGLVLVDGSVTPVQQRNLENAWDVKLLDRTSMILEIFAARARTREGVLQVELAALSYQRTRLVRAWTHLERQRGGLGFIGGPGETQIEADRRAIDAAIVRIRRQLAKVVKTRKLHRAARARVPFPLVALVGYTNAGKSTLFNRLTGASVVATDMLFATLDPTMRAVEIGSGTTVILSDTVGFISELPTQLVAAFRATLEEVLAADLIVHVRDISHPETEDQARDVYEILGKLGVDTGAPLIEVWNKIDNLGADERTAMRASADRQDDRFAISALTGAGLDRLLQGITAKLPEDRYDTDLALAFSDGQKRAWLHEQKVVTSECQTKDGYDVHVTWTKRQERSFFSL
jgi:GTP-binding protein HflX